MKELCDQCGEELQSVNLHTFDGDKPVLVVITECECGTDIERMDNGTGPVMLRPQSRRAKDITP